ncbi:hypothetical protein [Oribacterium sp. WCC10]|uniref:hypothetical protein n=1 Tax=Oribacterium sp. WCC10 TaxID=1855343 RepID=UPI0008E39AA9|nr:hypothetical protein [Oribacterium sp. WCC10]SFG65749.1 hypothetical protein SAMN05216356_11757 [Oribacterium sp. WCC10]
MKKNTKKTFAAIGICALLGIASVGAIASFADETTTAATEMSQPENNGMYMGKITAIDGTSITIETMMGGHGGKGQGQPNDGTAPTDANGEAMTPPTNASGETETPPEIPTDANGETLAAPADGGQQGGGMGQAQQTMTFTADSSLISGFAVGDMVDIISYDGTTVSAISASQQPADMGANTAS